MRALKLMAWVAAHKALSAWEDSGFDARAARRLASLLGGAALAGAAVWVLRASFGGAIAFGALFLAGVVAAGMAWVGLRWGGGAGEWPWGVRALAGAAGAGVMWVAALALGVLAQAALGLWVANPAQSRGEADHAWLADCEARVAAARARESSAGLGLWCRREGGRMGVVATSIGWMTQAERREKAREELGLKEALWESAGPLWSWEAAAQAAGIRPAGERTRGLSRIAPLWGEARHWGRPEWEEALEGSMMGWMLMALCGGFIWVVTSAAGWLARAAMEAGKQGRDSAQAWVGSAEFKARYEKRVLDEELGSRGKGAPSKAGEAKRRAPRL